uniref:Exocyst complex component 2 n=1 Tax=Callorhinchus milii TaxID=7868 RepID=A0A4W3JY28_CALMI
MARPRQPPLVTGISPNEGFTWTKVTIRGENLGTGPTDLTGLTICGHNCLLTAEWMSASKIVCRVGPAKNDKGDIIVTTKSGGRGTSTVSFRLMKPEKIGILDQSAVWVEEMNYYDMRTDRNKGISPLSLRPANPLGIDIDKGKVPQKDLEGLFEGMSGDFTSENFSATWYLIENHSVTSFDQLKVAANYLRKQANKKNEGSLAYVKGGLSTFFEAQDALSAIHQKLEVDGTEKVEGSMTQKLENVLNRASNTADALFQEVLGRKDKADSTRNALNVLQRFKFLFNLPLNIERNIQKGDYDVVINDYEKWYAIETRKLLMDKLLETPSTLHDQKRYIRYLSDLHAPGDPAWQCILAQHKWILQLMQNCRENYVKGQKGPTHLHTPMLDLDSDVRPSPISRLSQSTTLKRASSFQSSRDDSWRYKAPQTVTFVDNLTEIVISQLPNFWKLWISYVNGSLFSETGEKSAQVEKFKKNARSRQNDFKKMIQEVINSLVKLIRGALLPSSLQEVELRHYGGWETKTELPGQWLTHVIHTMRLNYESLTALEIPNDLLQTIQELILDVRVRCLIVTLQQTADDVKRLAEKEDWIVDNEGITSLPAQFEHCVVQTLQALKETIDCQPGETSVSVTSLDQVLNFVLNFPSIKRVLFSPLSLSVDISSPDLLGSLHENFSPTPEQRLLIVLSNCEYLARHTFSGLAEHFEKHAFQGTEKITQMSIDAVKKLDQTLFETYIEMKADPIAGSLEPGIYAGYFDWKDCLMPTGVRTYLKEALANIIAVHAEVFTISKELVPRVLSQIIEAVAEEMNRLMQCVSSFSKNGALQVLERCQNFKQALEVLPQLPSGADKKLLEELLNKFKSSMQLQLTCFQPSSLSIVKI